MSPSIAFNNLVHIARAYSKPSGERISTELSAVRNVETSAFLDNLWSHFRIGLFVSFPANVASLFHHIVDIVLLSSKKKVEWRTARRIVAGMKHLQSISWPSHQFKHNDVSAFVSATSFFFGPFFSTQPVSPMMPGFSNPRPALLNSAYFNFAPKVFLPLQRVIRVFAEVKMSRFTARSIVAMLANAIVFGNRSPSQFPRQAMRFLMSAIERQNPVALVGSIANPDSASRSGNKLQTIPKIILFNIHGSTVGPGKKGGN